MNTKRLFATAKVRAVALLLCVVSSSAQAVDFYVSNAGTDTNPGTINAPFYSIQKAADLARPADTIYVRGNAGAFLYTTTIRLTNSGTALAPIKLWAYPGEHPVLDFTNQPYGSSNRGILITTNTATGVGGSYWHIRGLEIARAGDNGIKIDGSHNTIEQCVLHHCGDTGLQIGFAHETDNPGTWGAFNTILNCDSYLNYDQDNRGSDADGFACKLHPGPGNAFISCRAWKNSDDGWDLFETDATVIISNCWTWHNGDATQYNVVGGSFQGNGNGMKLGGNGAGGSSVGVHYALNCVSFNNNFPGRTRHGFDQNSHHGGVIVYNCLSFGNLYNYFFEDSAGSNPQIFRNNVSNSGSVSDFGSGTVEDHNSWDPATGVTVTSADFTDLSEAAAEAPRQADGSLPAGFARLVAGSDLRDKGVNVGLPFDGSAPDLGAYEFVSAQTPPSAPTGLMATAGNAQVSLVWNASSGATSYNVKRATVSGGPYTTIGPNVTTTSFLDTGVSNGTTYFYVVSAVNSAGESPNSIQVSATPQAGGGQAPAAPSGLTATAVSSSQINLAWTDNANNETGFRVERAASAGGPFSQVGIAAANTTSFQNTGLSASTTYFYRVAATNSSGTSAFSNTASATTQAAGGTTVTFTSIATEDGRVLESSESSNTGGSVNSSEATSSALRTGDDNTDRQFKTILSFDTSSLPDGATVVSATLRMKRGSLTGTNPFTTHGSCFADIKGGTGFNNSTTLQTADFQAAADATQVATMSDPGTDGALSSGSVNVTGRGLINKTGKTQFRVYFSLDDNDDAGNDYIGWFSGNDATASNRPTLEVTYQ